MDCPSCDKRCASAHGLSIHLGKAASDCYAKRLKGIKSRVKQYMCVPPKKLAPGAECIICQHPAVPKTHNSAACRHLRDVWIEQFTLLQKDCEEKVTALDEQFQDLLYERDWSEALDVLRDMYRTAFSHNKSMRSLCRKFIALIDKCQTRKLQRQYVNLVRDLCLNGINGLDSLMVHRLRQAKIALPEDLGLCVDTAIATHRQHNATDL